MRIFYWRLFLTVPECFILKCDIVCRPSMWSWIRAYWYSCNAYGHELTGKVIVFLIQISLKADERDVYDFFSPAGKVSPDLFLELVVPWRSYTTLVLEPLLWGCYWLKGRVMVVLVVPLYVRVCFSNWCLTSYPKSRTPMWGCVERKVEHSVGCCCFLTL